MVSSVINFLSFLTLASNLLVGAVLLSWGRSKKFLQKKGVLISFAVSLLATVGSLFLSEVAKFTPCLLCWYQRILMYPLVIILGVALFKKTRDVAYYVLPLSVVGAIIAAYHYYLQINPQALAPCSAVGVSASCTGRPFTHFGYITIPWMAFSAFVVISLSMFSILCSSRRLSGRGSRFYQKRLLSSFFGFCHLLLGFYLEIGNWNLEFWLRRD